MSKPIVYVDMDGVLVDLNKEINKFSEVMPGLVNRLGSDIDKLPELFKNPEPVVGAIQAFKRLSQKYNVYILSTAPWDNPDAWTHKRLWVEKHLGSSAYKKLILSHNKSLLVGDYLIDDRTANGAGEFCGKLIQFGSKEYPNWDSVLEFLKA